MPLFMDVHERVDAPSTEAAAAVHKEAHGLLADCITPVQAGL